MTNGLSTNVYLTIGPAGSGKSTFVAENFEPHEIVSSDEVRELVFGDATVQHPAVWDVVRAIVKAKLVSHQSRIVIDATHCRLRDRRNMLMFIRTWGHSEMRVAGLVFCPAFEEMVRRNASRPRQVPVEVIKRHLHLFKSAPPTVEDGFDVIQIVEDAYSKVPRNSRVVEAA